VPVRRAAVVITKEASATTKGLVCAAKRADAVPWAHHFHDNEM
jgi:hypothetical protein